MIQRILVAADGPADALRLSRAVRELFPQGGGATATILQVLAPPVPPALSNPLAPPLTAADDVLVLGEANARRDLEPARDELAAAGFRAEVDVATGAAGEEICRYARAGGYQLIVVGRRGLGRLQEVLLGSVSEYVLRHTRLPVLVIQQEQPARNE